MIKALAGFALLLIAIGTGLSLYLPQYDETLPTVEPYSVPFTVLENTLDTPVSFSAISPSREAFYEALPKHITYALQLGVYGTLKDAKQSITQLAPPLKAASLSPTIFKTVLDKRYWFIVATGPFKTKVDQNHYHKLLPNSQPILWPPGLPDLK